MKCSCGLVTLLPVGSESDGIEQEVGKVTCGTVEGASMEAPSASCQGEPYFLFHRLLSQEDSSL